LIILFVAAILTVAGPYRFAWRPTTKVFPYDTTPPPSEIDNGDNNGTAKGDIILPAEVEAKE